MASVLIVEDDALVARHMARVLREAGHTPVLAPDARSAMREVLDHPHVILLDLGLPDCPGEELLRFLKRQAETAEIPVLVITGKSEAAGRLRTGAKGSVVGILLKPVSDTQLRRAVESALPARNSPDRKARRTAAVRRREVIRSLIVNGSDRLASEVYRRLCADRMRSRGLVTEGVLTWAEISDWARREGLLDEKEAGLLRDLPPPGLEEIGEGDA